MIRVIPNWLQDAIDLLNDWFGYNEDVNLTILWGYDSICMDDERGGFAAYNTESKSIYIADPDEIQKSCDLTEQDVIETTIMNLFHEYFHHQENIHQWASNEDQAEGFAKTMMEEYKKIQKYRKSTGIGAASINGKRIYYRKFPDFAEVHKYVEHIAEGKLSEDDYAYLGSVADAMDICGGRDE